MKGVNLRIFSTRLSDVSLFGRSDFISFPVLHLYKRHKNKETQLGLLQSNEIYFSSNSIACDTLGRLSKIRCYIAINCHYVCYFAKFTFTLDKCSSSKFRLLTN